MASTKRSYHGQLDEYLHRLIAYELTKNDQSSALASCQMPSPSIPQPDQYESYQAKRTKYKPESYTASYQNVNTKVIFWAF